MKEKTTRSKKTPNTTTGEAAPSAIATEAAVAPAITSTPEVVIDPPEAVAKAASPIDPMVIIEITKEGNSVLIGGFHHAMGKVMDPMPKSQADVLCNMKPPQAKIVGIA